MHSPDQFSETLPDEIVYPEHTSGTDRTRSFRTLLQTILLRYRPPTRAIQFSRTTRPNQCQSVRPTDQTTFPQSTNYLDIFTARQPYRQNANELLLIQVRCIPYGLGQGRLIHKALDEPCKAYYPHTFGLKSLDFLLSALINRS